MSDSHVIPFVINTRPICIWDTDIGAINLRFIKGIDSKYFQFIGDSSFAALEGENAKYAAITLRTTYAHALETFFALLGAALQAPDCVVGWMLQYRNEELNEVVKKIETNDKFLARFNFECSWQGIAKLILQGLREQQNFDEIVNGFADSWRDLAQDFLDPKNRGEYNSLKHGFRIQQGGFSISFGKPGERPFSENATLNEIIDAEQHMTKLEGSEHGSLYFKAEQFIPGNKFNFRLEHHALNWNNLFHARAIHLLVASIANVKTFLLAVNGQPLGTLKLEVFKDFSFLHEARLNSGIGVSNLSMSHGIHAEGIDSPLTEEDIRNSYKKPKNDSEA